MRSFAKYSYIVEVGEGELSLTTKQSDVSCALEYLGRVL